MNDKLTKQVVLARLEEAGLNVEIRGVFEAIYAAGGFVRHSHLEPFLQGKAGLRAAKRLKTELAYKHMMASKRGMVAKGVKE